MKTKYDENVLVYHRASGTYDEYRYDVHLSSCSSYADPRGMYNQMKINVLGKCSYCRSNIFLSYLTCSQCGAPLELF